MKEPGTPDSSQKRLIESLWLDARREAEKGIQKARAEADDLLKEARSFDEREMVLASEKAHREALPQVSRIVNRARNQARQVVLEERLAFLNSCFDEVAGRIGQDEGFLQKARSALKGLLDEALSAMGDPGKIEAGLNPEDISAARQVFDGKGMDYDLVGDGNIGGGIALRARSGSMVVDNTVEGRLAVLRETPPIDLLRLICTNQDE